MSEARTISTRPARKATTAMISSGRFPNVALSRPPTAGPVCSATCSVLRTIRAASGTMASAATRKTTGAATAARSRTIAIGINTSNQSIEGRSDIRWATRLTSAPR
jgi:hypothetical protein